MAKSSRVILLLGCVYIALSSAAFVMLYVRYGVFPVVVLFVTVWISDISAYATGRICGGPKLVPRISPNKTWSGAVGGIAGPMLVLGFFLKGRVAPEPLTYWMTIMATIAITALATELGDLLESAAKRRFNVKDSGWLIPGHGGILDRLDGLLLAAPVFFLIMRFGQYYS